MSTSSAIDHISEAIRAEIAPYVDENQELRESLADIRTMMSAEDRGWQAILGVGSGERVEGLDLAEVKMISEKARTKIAGASLEKRAIDLHIGYIFGQGLEIDGTERDPKQQGRLPGTIKFYEDVINQENLFSDSARAELQRARFTDGNIVVFCDTRKKQVRRIPFYEITGHVSNPDFPDEIWMWRRTWTHHKDNGDSEERSVWVYTDRFTGSRKKSVANGDKREEVLADFTAVDLRVNRQVGWVYGIPDATAGMMWTEAYGEVLQYGRIVNKQLATVVHRVVARTQKGAQQVGVKMGQRGVGGTAVVGEGQDISLVNATQKSFDFTAPRPLAAMAASAWNVTNPDLLNDSSASGSSYGSLSALTAGNLNAMKGMQLDWSEFFRSIFTALGFDRPGIHWEPMEQPDPYREAQQLKLYQDALQPEEYRAEVLDRLNIPGNPRDVPDTLKAIDAEAPKTGVQAASPDQGKSNGTGGATSGSKNDLRTDKVSEVLQMVQQDDFLREMRGLVERMETAVAQQS